MFTGVLFCVEREFGGENSENRDSNYSLQQRTYVSATRYARVPRSRAVDYALNRALRRGERSCQLERSITA